MAKFDAHLETLQDLVGSSLWEALHQEKKTFSEFHMATLLSPGKDDWDLIRKEVSAGVIRELNKFFSVVEDKVDKYLKSKRSNEQLDKH